MRIDAGRTAANNATLIRHFFPSLLLSIGPLTVGVIQLGGKAPLVEAVGPAVLLEACLAAAILTAIAITTVAATADTEYRTTPRPHAISLAKLDGRGTHVEPKAELDNGRRSWQARR